MREGGGKQKGASFEREVCTKLSLWISDGKREDLYWRSAMSGGRATVRNRSGVIKNVSQLGDITSVDSAGEWLTNNFIIECKSYKDLSIDSFLIKKKGVLSAFWEKLVKECLKADRGHSPLLIAKQDRWPTLVMTTTAGSSLLSFLPEDTLVTVPTLGCDIYNFDVFGLRKYVSW